MAHGITEVHFQTPEQVRAYLTEALAIVAELNPPDDLREHVFNHAATLLAAKNVQIQPTMLGVPQMAIPRGS